MPRKKIVFSIEENIQIQRLFSEIEFDIKNTITTKFHEIFHKKYCFETLLQQHKLLNNLCQMKRNLSENSIHINESK
jgi:hypothetical protein